QPPGGGIRSGSEPVARAGRVLSAADRHVSGAIRNGRVRLACPVDDGRARARRYHSNRIGAIDATRRAAIARLNNRARLGLPRNRRSDEPNQAQAPLQGIVIAVQSTVIRSTL